MEKSSNEEISNNERLFEEKITNIKIEIGFKPSTEWITRENHIQILTQTPFLMLVLGRVMLDSLQS